MNQLSRRPPRRELEKRAYRLAVGTGVAALATVVVLALAIPGVTEFSTAFLLALVTGGLWFAFRRTVS